ncbi:hypothetical protein COT97_02750 [Candidatus Falkowbacteria bacterium CG10_big_fil_rev_8_21_14_0_10_39_11]|uniref:Uncharacterized protein n=1 Tax=Candidatus Falkowbacteria bacterium CG10_big_fil_rev_8_21_14_0_10_39_11 TaxID=1974565 RepID=A0A2H0V525_9BACT|nr:MAG: hypothetical protein COT97_02750 [Candidatus Falkowbacteria bacterium CG10_big_fil_rev_8_21_14_0_10_39_11]
MSGQEKTSNRKALVQFDFYDGWGSWHTELIETILNTDANGKITPEPPSPLRGCDKDRWKLISVLPD